MHLVNMAVRRGGTLLCSQHKSILSRYLPALTVLKPRFKSTQKAAEDEIDLDAPLKFSTSRAASWKSHATYSGKETVVDQKPWYEPFVVVASVAVFLIYFCILREEADVDTKFSRTLYEHISGLEEQQLKLSLDYNASTGRDTTAIVERLAELERSKSQETSPETVEKSES